MLGEDGTESLFSYIDRQKIYTPHTFNLQILHAEKNTSSNIFNYFSQELSSLLLAIQVLCF